MTNAMRSFLDGLDATDKAAIASIAQEGGTSLTARMVRAVFTELLAAKVAEDEILAALEADHRADIDKMTEGWERVYPPEPPC
jgi:hypothetical protein